MCNYDDLNTIFDLSIMMIENDNPKIYEFTIITVSEPGTHPFIPHNKPLIEKTSPLVHDVDIIEIIGIYIFLDGGCYKFTI